MQPAFDADQAECRLRAFATQLAAALVGREISSANRCETPLDANAESCQVLPASAWRPMKYLR
jgi:hypothetical protein